MNIYVLLCMIFFHIIDDFIIQRVGHLGDMKQEQWWREHVKDYKFMKYKNDYIPPLLFHAFEWTFMITIPLVYSNHSLQISPLFYLVFFMNVTIHSIIDDLKANKEKINLCQDQIVHLSQILLTFILLGNIYGG